MKLCIVGIGGAGGKIAQEFLGNEDLDIGLISRITMASHISAGRIAGIWLEADKNDAKNVQHFFGDHNEGAYPGYFIPHDAVADGSDLHVAVRKKYGYDVKKQGFVRDAQYLKAIFEIFDTDKEIQDLAARTAGSNAAQADGAAPSVRSINPVFDSAWNAIRPYTTLGGGECDGILFIVSFGGGTGTGFINPIINHIRNEGKADYPVFVLGILTELGDGADRAQKSKEGRRNLAAMSALYDLLTKSDGANGVILVDNQMLMKKFGNDYVSANRFIYRIMLPIVAARDYPGEVPPGQAVAMNFSKGVSRPPLFVPLFASLRRTADPEASLVKKALSDGMLFGCNPGKADSAMVFCRGFIDSDKIKTAVNSQTGIPSSNVEVWRKMGERDNEILMLLRNPYGCDPEAYKKEGTLENRFCRAISSALDHINQNVDELFYEGKGADKEKDKNKDKGEQIRLTKLSKDALSQFFFGKEGFIKDGFGMTEGFAYELRSAMKRLESGNIDDVPFLLSPIRIFRKEVVDEHRPKQTVQTLEEKIILSIVNKRLADLKLIEDEA